MFLTVLRARKGQHRHNTSETVCRAGAPSPPGAVPSSRSGQKRWWGSLDDRCSCAPWRYGITCDGCSSIAPRAWASSSLGGCCNGSGKRHRGRPNVHYAQHLLRDSANAGRGKEKQSAVLERTGWICMRGRWRPKAPGGGQTTKWRSNRTFLGRKRSAPFSPRRAGALRPRSPRLGRACHGDTHEHKQCYTCVAVGGGIRHCCARGHLGHPYPPQPRRSRAAREGQDCV